MPYDPNDPNAPFVPAIPPPIATLGPNAGIVPAVPQQQAQRRAASFGNGSPLSQQIGAIQAAVPAAAPAPQGIAGLLVPQLPSARQVGSAVSDVASGAFQGAKDAFQPVIGAAVGFKNFNQGLLDGLDPPNPIAVSPPSQRVGATTNTAGPAAIAGTPPIPAAPTSPFYTGPGNADVDPQAAFNKQIAAPTNAAGSNTIARGNAGIASIAANPNAYNDLQAQNGTGISATSQGGRLTINGTAATQPQNFTQGYDLAGANARMRASLDAGYAADRQAQIADLTEQLGNQTNAPPGSARAAALTSQIAALSQIGQTQATGTARANLENAQGALAGAQAKQIGQQTQLSAQTQKQLSDLQSRFTSEPDPNKQKVLQDQILTLLGKDPKEGAFQIAMGARPIDPNNPLAGTIPVPYIINQRTGVAQSVEDAVANGIGQKGAPPGGGKFKEGQTYTDAQGRKATYKNGQFVPA